MAAHDWLCPKPFAQTGTEATMGTSKYDAAELVTQLHVVQLQSLLNKAESSLRHFIKKKRGSRYGNASAVSVLSADRTK